MTRRTDILSTLVDAVAAIAPATCAHELAQLEVVLRAEYGGEKHYTAKRTARAKQNAIRRRMASGETLSQAAEGVGTSVRHARRLIASCEA